MPKKLIVILKSDPRQSHRVCEGIRIALGLASGGHDVDIIFRKQSYFLLTEEGDEMIDGERAIQFLDTLKLFISGFLIEQEDAENVDLTALVYESHFISREMLKSKIADAECLFNF